MRQFAVYENLHDESKAVYPYLLNVQHPIHNRFESYLTIPLVFGRKEIPKLTPKVTIGERNYLVYTPEMLTMHRSMLGAQIADLSARSGELINAIDFLITGF